MEGGEVFVNQVENSNSDGIRKLAKDLTGFSLEDPSIIDQLVDDHKKINEKYNMPYLGELFNNPRSYFNNLKSLLDDNNIPLEKQSKDGPFFKQNPNAIACYFPSTTGTKGILLNEDFFVKNESRENNALLLAAIAHETIHGLQDKYYPDMSIEQKEYEAHIGTMPIGILREKSKDIKIDVEGIFKGISESIEIFNSQNKK